MSLAFISSLTCERLCRQRRHGNHHVVCNGELSKKDDGFGLLRGVDVNTDRYYSKRLAAEHDLAWMKKSAWSAAQADARELDYGQPEDYVKAVLDPE